MYAAKQLEVFREGLFEYRFN